MSDSLYTPPSGPPQADAPALFLQMGMDGLLAFCAEQYARLALSPIAAWFPSDPSSLQEASRKQAEFLAGVMGGPRIYAQKHGPPRMRARHFPFAIDETARQAWLDCFRVTLGTGERWGLNAAQAREWLVWTEAFSGWMVNRKPD